MRRIRFILQLEPPSSGGKPGKVFRWCMLAVYTAACGAMLAQAFQPGLFQGNLVWPQMLTLVLGLTTTLAWQTRRLPFQNVLLATAVIGGFAAGIGLLAAHTSVPFGPFELKTLADLQLLPGLAWVTPVYWVVALLNCRGVARLILRPSRDRPNYGLWVIGLTALLMACLAAVVDPFATRIASYWAWGKTRASLSWFDAPWSMFLGWLVTTVVILGFATPALINKKPVAQGPDYVPLALWASLMAVPAAYLAARGFLQPAVFSGACLVVWGGLAVWGGTYQFKKLKT